MALTFDPINRLIVIPIAYGTELTCQNLLNEVRDWEDSEEGMAHPQIIEGSGKEVLGVGVAVGITLKLLNWKVQFEARPPSTWVLCNISGGNLVAVNDVGDPMSPVEPSAYVTVTLTASSSATIQELLDIQHSSFEGGVWIDTINGTSGTAYPTGTARQPVDNLADAQTIASAHGLSKLWIKGNVTFGATDDIDNFVVEGQNPILSTITITSGCSTNGTEFLNCKLTGTLNGETDIKDSIINTLSGFQGCVLRCCLTGNITVAGTPTDLAQFIECYLASQFIGLIEINCNGDGPHVALRAYTGGVRITNKSGASKVAIDFISGRLEITSSVTAGTFFVRGVGEITSNQATGITMNDGSLINPDKIWDVLLSSHVASGTVGEALSILRKIETGRWAIESGQLIIYDTDGVTPLLTFNLSGEQTQAYSERTPV